MKANHIVSLLQDGYTTVHVHLQYVSEPGTAPTRPVRTAPTPADAFSMPQGFSSGEQQTWAYKSLLVDNVQPGDKVLVDARGQLKVGLVVSVDATPQIDVESDIDYKWIVQKVDMTRYEQILESERQFGVQMEEARKAAVRAQLKQQFFDSFPIDSPMRAVLSQGCTSLNQVLAAPTVVVTQGVQNG